MQMDIVAYPGYINILQRAPTPEFGSKTYYLTRFLPKTIKPRKHSSRMHTDRAITRPSSEQQGGHIPAKIKFPVFSLC